MRKIKVGRKTNKYMLVDDKDYDVVSKIKWGLQTCGIHIKRFYATNTGVRYSPTRHSVSAHRLIMHAKKGQIIDHKDGDGLNNQRSNLRFCNTFENQANRSAQGRRILNTYKGVKFDSKKKRWVAAITFHYKRIHIGRFKTELEAASAYDNVAKKLQGEFARLNIVPTPIQK